MGIIFNRDMLVVESDVINNIKNSMGIISNETLVANHPWVKDVSKELELLKKEKEEQQAEMEQQMFGPGEVKDDEKNNKDFE